MRDNLLLLLLSGGAHVLIEGTVGDLETGQSRDTGVQNGQHDDYGDEAHEDGYR